MPTIKTHQIVFWPTTFLLAKFYNDKQEVSAYRLYTPSPYHHSITGRALHTFPTSSLSPAELYTPPHPSPTELYTPSPPITDRALHILPNHITVSPVELYTPSLSHHSVTGRTEVKFLTFSQVHFTLTRTPPHLLCYASNTNCTIRPTIRTVIYLDVYLMLKVGK